MSIFGAYAPPFVYGPWQEIASHIGRITYTITYSPIGDAQAYARVKYFTDAGPNEAEFADQMTFTTGDVVATVSVSFKTLGPTGVSVNGTVYP